MATITVTTDMTLEEVFTTTAYVKGDIIYINNGAVVTCDETPSNLLSQIRVNEGELIIDGENISTGNSINFNGMGGHASYDQLLAVYGAGTLTVRGKWYDIGTTDGTDSQAVDLSSATGSDYWDGDQHIGWIPMIQIETGRRITYDGASGVDPKVGDWVYKTSDRSIMGKIHSVGADYIVVWYLTGALVDDDDIVIRSIVDNRGPDLQNSWTAKVNNASGDIKEAGVYHEFGNSRSDSTSFIADFHHGIGGFVFDHAWQSTDITLGSSAGTTGGFVPPTGCNIRIPNVVFGSAVQTDYDLGLLTDVGTSYMYNYYQLEFSSGGTIDLSICNFGNFYTYDSGGFAFDAEYVGASVAIGSSLAGNRTTYHHCVVTQDVQNRAVNPTSYAFSGLDISNGTDVTFCQVINPQKARTKIGVETSGASNVSDCIHTYAGVGTALSGSQNTGYYFTKTHGSTATNNVFIGADSSALSSIFYVLVCNDFTNEMFLVSCTQDETPMTQEVSMMYVGTSQRVYVSGIEIIGDGVMGNQLLNVADSYDVKLRCLGMIDDKVDFGTDGEASITPAGTCSGIDMARVWRYGGEGTKVVSSFGVTVSNATVTNCSGEYESLWTPSGGNNVRLKGVHGASGTPGGSRGIEDAHTTKYGNSIHDGMRSDTVGFIVNMMITPSADYDETTVIAGQPVFDKAGDLDMVSGDIIEFEQGYFAKGHTGFPGTFSAVTTTSAWNADEWANVDLDFQYQLEGGSWSGTWLDVRTPANWTGITGAIEEGIKLKFRFEATGTQASMSMLIIDTDTTLTAQKNNFYPIDQTPATLEITGLTGNEQIYVQDDSGTQVAYETSPVGTYTYENEETASGTWKAVVKRAGYDPYFVTWDAQSGNTEGGIYSNAQKVQPSGAVMYTNTTSTDVNVVIDLVTPQISIDISAPNQSGQTVFDETEDAMTTADGMNWLVTYGTETTYADLGGAGKFLFHKDDIRARRESAGDTNAGIDAYIFSTDTTPVDETNGTVQLFSGTDMSTLAAEVWSQMTDDNNLPGSMGRLLNITNQDRIVALGKDSGLLLGGDTSAIETGKYPSQDVTATTTLEVSAYPVLVVSVDATAGDIVLTLPPVADADGKMYSIKRIDETTNTVTIDGAGTDTIDSELTLDLPYPDAPLLYSDGDDWRIV